MVWRHSIDIDPSVSVACRWCPDTVTMLNLLAPIQVCALILWQYRIVVEQCRTDNLPVYQVGTVQNLQAWETLEGRGGHIVVIAHTAYIWVRVVGVNYRVAIHSVLQVRIPGLGYCFLGIHDQCSERRSQCDGGENAKE